MTEKRSAKILVIAGSSRNDGHTWEAINAVRAKLWATQTVDLNARSVAPYDYGESQDDDFLEIARAMASANAIVFASPVYWYAMSAQMKAFFDRLTDLTGAHKTLGKKLAGKTAFLIASGGSSKPPAAFEPPFADTARYFKMHWGGMLYAQSGSVDPETAAAFAARISAAAHARETPHAQSLRAPTT